MSETEFPFVDEQRSAEVCRKGQGAACCRYLVMSGGAFGCAKHTYLREALDARGDSMAARGDNCEGLRRYQREA